MARMVVGCILLAIIAPSLSITSSTFIPFPITFAIAANNLDHSDLVRSVYVFCFHSGFNSSFKGIYKRVLEPSAHWKGGGADVEWIWWKVQEKSLEQSIQWGDGEKGLEQPIQWRFGEKGMEQSIQWGNGEKGLEQWKNGEESLEQSFQWRNGEKGLGEKLQWGTGQINLLTL